MLVRVQPRITSTPPPIAVSPLEQSLLFRPRSRIRHSHRACRRVRSPAAEPRPRTRIAVRVLLQTHPARCQIDQQSVRRTAHRSCLTFAAVLAMCRSWSGVASMGISSPPPSGVMLVRVQPRITSTPPPIAVPPPWSNLCLFAYDRAGCIPPLPSQGPGRVSPCAFCLKRIQPGARLISSRCAAQRTGHA